MLVTPYLFFNGSCEEALRFYESNLGAQITMLMRYKDSPTPVDPAMVPPEALHLVMHATFRVGESTISASDACGARNTSFGGFGLSLQPETAAAAERLFGALSEGGDIRMPLAETFFSPSFGMVADRFGVLWMVYVPQTSP